MNGPRPSRPKPRPFAIDRETTPVRIATALRAEILRGALPPGTRIPELDFTAAFGVSRHTLREAISLLVAEGLLTRTSFKGVEVTKLSAEDVRDNYAARRVIELAAVDALPTAPAPLREALMTAMAALAALSPDGDEQVMNDADVAMHQALVASLGSKRLSAIHRTLMAEIRILLVRVYNAMELAETREAHRLFARHLAAGDIDAARRTLDHHLRQSEALLLDSAAQNEEASPR